MSCGEDDALTDYEDPLNETNVEETFEETYEDPKRPDKESSERNAKYIMLGALGFIAVLGLIMAGLWWRANEKLDKSGDELIVAQERREA